MDLDPDKISKKELYEMLETSVLESKKKIRRQKKQIHRQKKNNQKLTQKVDGLEKEVDGLEKEVKWLAYQVEQLKRMQFGSKRERFEGNPSQLEISFEEYATKEEKEDTASATQTITYERKKTGKQHKGRNRIPEDLPVIEHIIEPEEDTTDMVRIGEEQTEILGYSPEKFFKLVFIRPKYARKEDNQSIALNSNVKNVLIAPLPERPIHKCLAGNRLLSAILVNKYVDHLPLYRQKQIFKRSDIEIASSTIDSWVGLTGKLLKPLYKRLAREVKAQNYLQADETTTKVLDKKKKGKTHLGYYWAYHAPLIKAVVFDYQKGRSIDAARDFLEGYEGVLQTDGYRVYRHFYSNEEVTHLACWAHARRKFEHALSNNKKVAGEILLQIQKLYAIERKTKEMTPEERKEIRLREALPIINELGEYLFEVRKTALPKSPLGRAVEYTVPLWESLQNYLQDGNLEIDNNLIENKIQPIALGRKNYLFAGSHNGAERSAMFYSFFACCKLNDINPMKWMNYVLGNITSCPNNRLQELLPSNIDAQKLGSYKEIWEV